MIVDESDERVPPLARACVRLLVAQLQLVNARTLGDWGAPVQIRPLRPPFQRKMSWQHNGQDG